MMPKNTSTSVSGSSVSMMLPLKLTMWDTLLVRIRFLTWVTLKEQVKCSLPWLRSLATLIRSWTSSLHSPLWLGLMGPVTSFSIRYQIFIHMSSRCLIVLKFTRSTDQAGKIMRTRFAFYLKTSANSSMLCNFPLTMTLLMSLLQEWLTTDQWPRSVWSKLSTLVK